MADNPQLIVALEARLDKFERQMKEAGLIAEREIKAIEGKTSQIAIGSGIGIGAVELIKKAMEGIKSEIETVIREMLALGDASRKTATDLEALQRISFAGQLQGIGKEDTLRDISAAAAKMEEMNRRTTRLSELLDANNLKYRDQQGLVVGVDKGLELAATLMSRAGSELEKIEIARLFGLTEKWVGALGGGAEAFRQMKAEAPVKELEQISNHMRALEQLANRLKASFSGWGAAIVTSVLPALDTVAGLFSSMAQGLARVAQGGPMAELAERLANEWGRVHGEIKSARVEAERTRIEVNKPSGVVQPDKGGLAFKDALDRANDSLSRTIGLTRAELATIGQTVEEQEKLRQETLLTEAAKRAGLDPAIAVTQEMKQQAALAGQLKGELVKAKDQWQRMADDTQEVGRALSDAVKGLVLEGKKLDEVLKNIGNRMASRAFDRLFDLLFAAPAGGGAAPILSLLSGRQSGGPVSAGTPYMVGEKGAELFVPKQGGMIVPNNALRGIGGGMQQSVVINDYSGQARVQKNQTSEGQGVEVFIPALETMLAGGVARGRGALAHTMDARQRRAHLYG